LKEQQEQREHLKNLLEQRNNLEKQINQNRELFWKVQGAIEYLTQTGVNLSEPEVNLSEPEVKSEVVEENA
jgi:seryl-tRNA synthetase